MEEVTVKKLIDFKDAEFTKAVQLYADENTNGNFSLAVTQLVKAGIGFGKKCRSRCPVGK